MAQLIKKSGHRFSVTIGVSVNTYEDPNGNKIRKKLHIVGLNDLTH